MDREWSKIYDEHAPSARAVLFRMGLVPPELDDLLQECFIKVWKGLPKFRGDSSLKTWVTRIAVNCAKDHFRKRGVNLETEEIDEEKLEGREDVHEDHGERKIVESALEALALIHREVLVLHVIEEHSVEEVAEIAGISPGTVKSRLHHARANLQKILLRRGVRYE